MGQDTVIVLLYAVFCVVFGFVTALLVMLADKMKGDRDESGRQSEQANAEVRKHIKLFLQYVSRHALTSRVEQTKMMSRKM